MGASLSEMVVESLRREALAERMALEHIDAAIDTLIEVRGDYTFDLLKEWIEDRRPPGEPPEPRKKPIPVSLRVKVQVRDGGKCCACGTDQDLSIDHIYPESRGGLTVLENLQTLCRSCNSRKGARV